MRQARDADELPHPHPRARALSQVREHLNAARAKRQQIAPAVRMATQRAGWGWPVIAGSPTPRRGGNVGTETNP